MKRTLQFSLLTLFVVACESSISPSVDQPDFGILDGSDFAQAAGAECAVEDPCFHFFFLPPLVPTPAEFHGDFNGALRPQVDIAVALDTLSTECVQSPPVRTFKSEITADGDKEQYSVGWQTGADNLDPNVPLRICVRLGAVVLGFRDVMPVEGGAEVPRNPEQDPVLRFNNGSNIPIKFRIETGLFCAEGADCGEATVDAGGGVLVTTSGFAALDIEDGALGGEFTLIIEEVPCDTTSDGRIRHLDIDLPQFPGCYDLRTDPPLVDGFNAGSAVIAGVCYDVDAVGDLGDYLQLHHEKANGQVEALANVAPPVGLACDNFQAVSSTTNPLVQFARSGLRAVQRVLPWLSPPPLHAGDRGFGGGSLGGLSPLVWAAPAQFAKVNDNFLGDEGEIVTPQVLVTTEDRLDGDGNTFTLPVPGATVHFVVTLGDGPPIGSVFAVSDALGIAQVDWTLGPVGVNNLEASGNGIGVALSGGGSYRDSRVPPNDEFQPFAEHLGSRVDLGIGVLEFTAVACPVGPTIDGVFDSAEWSAANSEPFTANLSRTSSAAATLYWMNDCDNLYLAVVIERDEEAKVNTLGFDFDNDGDGEAAVGDDVLVLDGDGGGFTDLSLNKKCLNRGQSACGDEDPDQHGEGKFAFDPGDGVIVYEVSHPLNSGDPNDFSLQIGDTVGMFLSLRLGKGAQGNTQWPGFRIYLPITIEFPVATAPITQ